MLHSKLLEDAHDETGARNKAQKLQRQLQGSGNHGVVDEEYSIFLCQSQKNMVLVQCIFYAIYFTTLSINSFTVDFVLFDKPSGFWESLGISCFFLNATCTGALYQSHSALLEDSSFVTASNLAQVILSLLAAILVRRRHFQKKWIFYSTMFLILAALTNSLIQDILGSGSFVWSLGNVSWDDNLTKSNISLAIVRAVALETMFVSSYQRQTSVAALQLLAFAPRFKPYCIVCSVMFLVEVIGESIAKEQALTQLAGGVDEWLKFLNIFKFSITLQSIYANVSPFPLYNTNSAGFLTLLCLALSILICSSLHTQSPWRSFGFLSGCSTVRIHLSYNSCCVVSHTVCLFSSSL